MQAEEPHGPICEIARQQKCKDFSRPENIPATNIKKGVENVFLASVTFFAEQYTLKAFLYACSSGVTIFISQCESLLHLEKRFEFSSLFSGCTWSCSQNMQSGEGSE